MKTTQPAADGRNGGPARVARAARGGSPHQLWRVATPGVCRLVDDPDRLARLLRSRPDAIVVRLGTERPL